jgi:L-rhamnose mutarotase
VSRTLLTLDLKDDPAMVEAYRKHHAAVWPEVLKSLRRVGVREMEIFALGRRLVMLMETEPGFDAERDFARHNSSHPRCGEWEALMKTFQEPSPGAPPGAPPGRLWTAMEPVFSLRRQLGALERRRPAKRGQRKRKARG